MSIDIVGGSEAMIDFDEAVALLRNTPSALVAIDGLPVSGKSTLAERLERELGAEVVYLDDFVRPERDWRGTAQPGFPFPYIRYDAFTDAVLALGRGQVARYRYHDWAVGQLADEERVVQPCGLVVVEGVSALSQDLAHHYDLRFWIESDAKTTLAASLARGVGDWEQEWRELFMPSVELYLATRPQRRADHLVRGRGAMT